MPKIADSGAMGLNKIPNTGTLTEYGWIMIRSDRKGSPIWFYF
jgi:hypothetical protein